MDNMNSFSLTGGNYYITENERDAYRVKSGSVLVFVVPLKSDNSIGRRSFIYEASEGEVIPSFCYKDIEYCQWRFCFVAVEKATVDIIENGSTKVLKERFSQKAKIRNFKIEGFNGGLIDQYRFNIVTEDGFIRRTQKQRVTTAESVVELIIEAFSKKDINADIELSNNMIYDSMAVLCYKSGVEIASFEKVKDACGNNVTVSDIARISHFSYREVVLENGWHKEDAGSFIVFDTNKKPYVCLTKGIDSYVLYDCGTKSLTPVSEKVAHSLSPKAYMIYRPLPSKKITKKDILSFCLKGIRKADAIWLTILTVATALIGLLTPIINQKLYDEYIPLGEKTVLFQLGCVMASFMIANIMFFIVKNLVNFRITTRMGYDMQAAVYDRLFNLQESFFRKFESADLGQRVMGVSSVVNSYASVIITSTIALVYSVIYLCQMSGYSDKLTLIGLAMIVGYSVIYYLISSIALKYEKTSVELEGKTSSVMYQFLGGISKIRIAGVEDRAIFEYLKPYIKYRNTEAKKNRITNLGTVLNLVIDTVFSIVMYVVIIKGNMDISLGAFIAFNSVFGTFTAYVLQLVGGFVNIKNLKPAIDRLKPILEEEPELDDAKELPGEISGAIEINNVSFRYEEGAPNVLNNLSLDIKAGEYVGIVGSSGCGKSTLLKLLLGFESTTSGKIYYDNKDIESLDKRELRKKMGVVLQDGKLISGSIFENITITAPNATVADVKKVIKAVGLENDINDMPMGLHTVLSEDCGTISGGQQQRILIARAIIANPKLLFFDEATSALDNVTQSMVCETLEAMDSTRIVIAHRLSTIMKCDRIIVLDAGSVVEQGTYEELMRNKGLFYELASRQIA